jgi:1-acyl-sn-glycerol-3-phosphate acyltransferase
MGCASRMEVASDIALPEESVPRGNHSTVLPDKKRQRALSIPVSRSKPPGRFYDTCRVLWLGIFKCTMRIHISGLEKMAGIEDGMLLAVSHVSHLDPIVVSAVLSRRVSWVSRIEFFQNWISRKVLYHGGAFRVDRRGAALPTIREGLKRLSRGEAIGIFPEGEVMQGERSALRGASVKHGVCTLAARSGCPVVPVVVLGTDKLRYVGPWLPAKRGKLWMLVGEPLQPELGDHTKEGRRRFAARLEAEYVKLFAELRRTFSLPESIVP